MIILLSELPPPLSACFNNAKRRGRVKTARYKAWIQIASYQIVSSEPTIKKPVAVTYRLKRPDNLRRDLDNMSKALGDILVSTGIIEDDSLIHDLRLVWHGGHPVEIEIREM